MTLFYSEKFLAPHPTLKLKEHPFSSTLHTGGCSSICNLRMCHTLVMDPLLMDEPAPWNFLTTEQLATHYK
jgi:hypothetical protein